MFRLLLSAVLYLAGSGTSTGWAASDPLTDGNKAQLEYILLHDCGSCHGMTLKGGLGPAITADALQNKAAEYLFHTISEGISGTPMPPWLGILSEPEIHYLVKILKQGKLSK